MSGNQPTVQAASADAFPFLQLACYGASEAKHVCLLCSKSECGECVWVTQLYIGCLLNTR